MTRREILNKTRGIKVIKKTVAPIVKEEPTVEEILKEMPIEEKPKKETKKAPKKTKTTVEEKDVSEKTD